MQDAKTNFSKRLNFSRKRWQRAKQRLTKVIKQVKDKLVTALKNFGSKAMSFAKAPKIKVQKDIQNMILTTMVVTGLAILAGSIKIIFTDLSGSDMGLSEVLLGSRTGEAISLGIGLS